PWPDDRPLVDLRRTLATLHGQRPPPFPPDREIRIRHRTNLQPRGIPGHLKPERLKPDFGRQPDIAFECDGPGRIQSDSPPRDLDRRDALEHERPAAVTPPPPPPVRRILGQCGR